MTRRRRLTPRELTVAAAVLDGAVAVLAEQRALLARIRLSPVGGDAGTVLLRPIAAAAEELLSAHRAQRTAALAALDTVNRAEKTR